MYCNQKCGNYSRAETIRGNTVYPKELKATTTGKTFDLDKNLYNYQPVLQFL